ncbi:acetyltransferase [Pollutimonas sp. H1-120]|uniref:acetyltransferase n=1 Tax=Pollutimonas sp. H1-120 TaxID=3148824 RepID=UPI003B521439
MKKKKLFVVGAGGHGRSVAEAAMLGTAWSEVVFVDDAYPLLRYSGQWPIVANIESLAGLIAREDSVVIAIGNQSVRKRLFGLAQDAGAMMATIIHPKAWVSQDASIGDGTAVMAGAIIGTQAKVGMGAIVNANATVDHDAVLGDFAHLGVGVQLAGGVVVGDGAWLQAGTCAGYRVRVPPDAVVLPGTALQAVEAQT